MDDAGKNSGSDGDGDGDCETRRYNYYDDLILELAAATSMAESNRDT